MDPELRAALNLEMSLRRTTGGEGSCAHQY